MDTVSKSPISGEIKQTIVRMLDDVTFNSQNPLSAGK